VIHKSLAPKKVLFLHGGDTENFIAKSLRRRDNVLLIQQEKITLDFLRAAKIDEVVSYGYRHILAKEVVTAFRKKIINLHISYLPYNRGASPNLWSVIEDTTPGVSIHYIDEGIDTGDILCQDKIELDYHYDTLRTSYKKLIEQMEFLYMDMIPPFGRNWSVQKQKHKGTYHSITQTNKLLEELKLSNGWDTKISEVSEKAIALGYREK